MEWPFPLISWKRFTWLFVCFRPKGGAVFLGCLVTRIIGSTLYSPMICTQHVHHFWPKSSFPSEVAIPFSAELVSNVLANQTPERCTAGALAPPSADISITSS